MNSDLPHTHVHPVAPAPARTWREYVPLLMLLLVSILFASALKHSYGPGVHPVRWMHGFMGFFLIVFALLKLFDLRGFADGFQQYDLLARHFRPYALAYPFIELTLGLGFIAFWQPATVYLITAIVMGFGAIGVILALRRGLDIRCACMGTALKVPLSTVTLIEDLGMALMAAAMWLRILPYMGI